MRSTKSWGSGSGVGMTSPSTPVGSISLGALPQPASTAQGEEDGTGTQEPQGRGVHAPSMAQGC